MHAFYQVIWIVLHCSHRCGGKGVLLVCFTFDVEKNVTTVDNLHYPSTPSNKAPCLLLIIILCDSVFYRVLALCFNRFEIVLPNMAPSKKKGDPWRLPESAVKLVTELMQSGDFMQAETAVLSGMSVRSVQTIARNFRRHGQATNACRKKPGRLNLLSEEYLSDLTFWLISRPSTEPTHLNEMKQYLLDKFGVEASLTTIHRSLTNVGVVQNKSVWRKRATEPSAHSSVEQNKSVVIVGQSPTQPIVNVIDQTSNSSNESSTALPHLDDFQANDFTTSADPGT